MEILLNFKEAVEAGAPEKELRFAIKDGKIKYRKIAGLRGKYLFYSSLLYFFPKIKKPENLTLPAPEALKNEDIFYDLLEKAGSQSKLAKKLKIKRQIINFIKVEFEKEK